MGEPKPRFVTTSEAPYSLMLRARWRAFKHSIQCGTKGHRIWRVYSHWGFKTYRVFCECGKEFK
jgi:hypothetical protein